MTSIYLIRHAEAEGNLYRIAQGQDDSLLTDRGWRQVRALERRFADIPIDAVYSSDLYRTCATASALYLPKGLPLRRRKALREIHVGVWERRTWGDILRSGPAQMENFGSHPESWQVEGAESPRQVLDRALEELRQIVRENPGRTAAAVTHGYVIRLVLAALEGVPLEETGRTPFGDNTAVSLLEGEAEDLRVVFRDDASHLKTPEYLAEEPVRERASNIQPGLFFRELRMPEEGAVLERLSGGRPPETAGETLLAGFLDEEPVGAVGLGVMEGRAGWITMALVREDCRRQGFGVQLIGQAVYYWRPRGAQALRIALPEGAGESFWREYGFVPAGGNVWEKSIRFDPQFLGERA